MVLTGNSTVPRTIGALDGLDAGSVRLPIFVLLTRAQKNESRIRESGLGPHGRRLGTSWLGGESGSFFLGVSWSGIQGLELLLGGEGGAVCVP